MPVPRVVMAVCAAALLPAGPAVGQDALTLPAAIAEALAVHPGTQSAQQQAIQARARLAQADAQRRPQILFTSTGGGSSVNVIQPPPAYQNFGTLQNGFTISLPLGARPRLASLQAREQLTSAQAQVQTARIALAAQVTGAYFDLLRKQALGEIARETRTEAERQLSDTTKRFRAGDVPELDTLRSQVPAATAQANEVQADTETAIARQTLNALLGRPLSAGVTIADIPVAGSDAVLPYTSDEAREKALAASPDIRAAQATERAASAALAAARRFRDPTLSLQALDTRSNDKTGFSRDDTIQASVTIPLSDGGLGRAQVQEAEAALAQARSQTVITTRAVEAAVASAYLSAESRRKQIQAATVARDIAAISYDKTVRGYQAGLFSLSDLLSTQTALTQARIAYTQALYEVALSANALSATVAGAQEAGITVPILSVPGALITPPPPVPATGGKPGGSSSHDNTPSGPVTAPPGTPTIP